MGILKTKTCKDKKCKYYTKIHAHTDLGILVKSDSTTDREYDCKKTKYCTEACKDEEYRMHDAFCIYRRREAGEFDFPTDPSDECKCCGGDIAIANPTGWCCHIYYPEYCMGICQPTPKQEEWCCFCKEECGHISPNQAHIICNKHSLPSNSQGESLRSQIDRLADFIINEIPGEPSENEGAVDTAIRLLKKCLPSNSQEEKECGCTDHQVCPAHLRPGMSIDKHGVGCSVCSPQEELPEEIDDVILHSFTEQLVVNRINQLIQFLKKFQKDQERELSGGKE